MKLAEETSLMDLARDRAIREIERDPVRFAYGYANRVRKYLLLKWLGVPAAFSIGLGTGWWFWFQGE